MLSTERLLERVDALIGLGQKGLTNLQQGAYGAVVDAALFTQLRSSALSFIETVYGRNHSYYQEFSHKVADSSDYYVKYGVGILTGIREEIAGGWLITLRGLIAAEFFADFLEMAEHLVGQGYKDPAAVLAGGVLEEHLRQLAAAKGIATVDLKDRREVPRKADTLNAELAKADAYSKLDQKSVTSWLDLRNKAAHGKYADFTQEQVAILITAVRDFVTRNPG